jgi:cell division septation protein DedD
METRKKITKYLVLGVVVVVSALPIACDEEKKETPPPPKKEKKEEPVKKGDDNATVDPKKGGFTVCLASNYERWRSNNEAKRVEKRGVTTTVLAMRHPQKGRVYRVLSGQYPDYQSARMRRDELRRKTSESRAWVVALSK